MAHENLLHPARLYKQCPEIRELATKFRDALNGSRFRGLEFDAAMDAAAAAFNRRVQEEPLEVRSRLKETAFYHLANEALRLAVFESSGRQSFLISDDVIRDLQRTELGAMKVGDIRPPFPSLFVGFDRPVMGMSGAWVAAPGDGSLSIAIVMDAISPDWWPDWAPCEAIGVAFEEADQLLADAVVNEVSRVERKLVDRADEDIHVESQAVAHGVAFIANVLCLLGAMPAEMLGEAEWLPPRPPVEGRSRSAEKRARAAALEAGSLEVRRLTFGHSAPHGGAGDGSDRVGPRAHWRRGHWRRQQVGPASARTFKPVWIRPTLVNPDRGGTAETSIYDVKSSGEA